MARLSGQNYGRMSTTQKIEDLPASGGTPLEIQVKGDLVAQLVLYSSADFFWTMADTLTNATTRLSSDATRCAYPSGMYVFPVAGEYVSNFFITSKGSAVTDGVSYSLVNFD